MKPITSFFTSENKKRKLEEEKEENKEKKQATIDYIIKPTLMGSFLSQQKLGDNDLLEQCVESVKGLLVHKPEIVVHGEKRNQARNVGFFSNDSKGYRYSGTMAASKALTPPLASLLTLVNSKYSAAFNGILVNEYVGGDDYISPHSDNESYLDPDVGVVAVAFGAERLFRVKSKKDKKTVVNVQMKPGLLIHMGGAFQQEFTHEVPKQKTITGTRTSFTFRKHAE